MHSNWLKSVVWMECLIHPLHSTPILAATYTSNTLCHRVHLSITNIPYILPEFFSSSWCVSCHVYPIATCWNLFTRQADPVDCALDLMRRLPPQKVEENLADLVELAPHLTDELVSGIDTPLRTQRCSKTGRDYLLSDYNRDGDSYR